jgi:SAM-dependent methyltransferase
VASSLSGWLALREAADSAARSVMLTRTIAEKVAHASPLHVLDLGAGTGANLRYLLPRLRGEQRWLLVDYDTSLLAEARARLSEAEHRASCALDTRGLDLETLDHPGIFDDRHLITASALLDLVSESWLQALACRCREIGAAALFALNYNGQSTCWPAEPEDDVIRHLMNRHQKSDKGLGGVAAGPDAVDCAERCFSEAGYQVQRDVSNWVLPHDERELQEQLIKGWAHAAEEVAPEDTSRISDWLSRRLAHVKAGRSRIVVGHEDLAAWL